MLLRTIIQDKTGLTEYINMLSLFVSYEVNTNSVAAFYAQFTVSVNSQAGHHLSLFIYRKAFLFSLNKLIYFPADEF